MNSCPLYSTIRRLIPTSTFTVNSVSDTIEDVQLLLPFKIILNNL